MLTIIVISIAFIYFILHFIFLLGFLQSSKIPQRNDNYKPSVTLIVAARNEECNIAECIHSLKNISYSNIEFILVNDQSTDRTRDIIIEEISGLPKFKLIDTINDETVLKGKIKAINQAIKLSNGEIIIMTDADCTVQKTWVDETVKYYHDNISMVCGFTLIKADNSLFAKLQSLDWLYLLSLASSSSGIGYIMSCIGNNLTYKKECYNNIGGYESIKFSVTEDLALLREMDKMEKYKVIYPINPRNLVLTNPCYTIKELYRQKKRWFRGGAGINVLGLLTGIILYTMSIVLLTGFLYIPFITYLIIILIKSISELLIVIPTYKKLEIKGLIRYFPLFQIYFALYGISLPFTFFTGNRIIWKDRKI